MLSLCWKLNEILKHCFSQNGVCWSFIFPSNVQFAFLGTELDKRKTSWNDWAPTDSNQQRRIYSVVHLIAGHLCPGYCLCLCSLRNILEIWGKLKWQHHQVLSFSNMAKSSLCGAGYYFNIWSQNRFNTSQNNFMLPVKYLIFILEFMWSYFYIL